MATLRDEAARERARNRPCCETCGLVPPLGMRLDASHFIARGMGGGRCIDHDANLAGQCRWCHGLWEDGKMPKQKMLEAIAAREPLDIGEIEAFVWSLIRKPKPLAIKPQKKPTEQQQRKK